MVTCGKCGFEMNDEDKFCFNCGTPKKAPIILNDPQETSNIDLRQSSGKTEVICKNEEKEGFAIFKYSENGKDKEFIMSEIVINIGRNPKQCELVLSCDKYIGRNHALVYLKNSHFYLVDLNSKNWTFINNKRIQGVKQLENQCILKFANTEVNFKVNV